MWRSEKSASRFSSRLSHSADWIDWRWLEIVLVFTCLHSPWRFSPAFIATSEHAWIWSRSKLQLKSTNCLRRMTSVSTAEASTGYPGQLVAMAAQRTPWMNSTEDWNHETTTAWAACNCETLLSPKTASRKQVLSDSSFLGLEHSFGEGLLLVRSPPSKIEHVGSIWFELVNTHSTFNVVVGPVLGSLPVPTYLWDFVSSLTDVDCKLLVLALCGCPKNLGPDLHEVLTGSAWSTQYQVRPHNAKQD